MSKVTPELLREYRKRWHFNQGCESCSGIEVECEPCLVITGLLDEVERLRGLWCCLGIDVAQAVQHRNTKGGQQVHPPSFAMMPLSIQVQLDRYLRWALGDNWEEEVQKQ